MQHKYFVIFLVIIAALSALFIFAPDDKKPSTTITIKVDTLDASPNQDKTIVVPKVAVEQAEKAHTDERDETPPNVAGPVLQNNIEEQQTNRKETEALPTAGASGNAPGCVTAFVRNQSSRRGVRPTVQVLHYTVSPNRPGRSDVNGITAFFNQSNTQASSNFVIDAEGNCNYIVPIEAKAWTQAGGNPWAVSYEIIDTGKEADYLGPAGYKKLASVMRWVSGKTGIPLRSGKISGCAPSRSGIVQHADGGSCWGGHHDIGPFPFGFIINKLTTNSCDQKCRRHKRHVATHIELKRRHCAPPGKTRSERCQFLNRRHAAIHKASGQAAPR